EDGWVSAQAVVPADAEAVQAAEVGGGKLEDRVRLSDLPDAGWKVEPWVRNVDGSASLTLRKPLASAGEIHLGAIGTGIADDAELVQQLQAQGVDVAGVDAQLLDQLQRAFTVRLVVELPGRAPVTIEPAAGASAPVDVASSVQDTRRVTLVAVAGALLVLAMIVAVWPRRRRKPGGRRARRRGRRT